MFRTIALALLLATPAAAQTCAGQNLITALPAADLAVLRAKAEVPFAQGNLWQATKDGQSITIVGTYHLADPRFAPVVAALTPVLDRATTLLVEAGPEEEKALQAKVTSDPKLMFLTTGPTLPEQLSPTDWDLLAKALKARGMAPFMAAKMQPWLVASFLELPACMFPLDAGSDQGLDKLLIKEAEARGLPIQALEPFDTILGIFARFSPQDQLAMLTQSVAADAQSDDTATTLADSYFAGESRLFWEFSQMQARALPGMTEAEALRETALVEGAILSDRNRAWIPVLDAAARKGPVLAAFGALHLSGETGVLNLLAQDGWTITPLAP